MKFKKILLHIVVLLMFIFGIFKMTSSSRVILSIDSFNDSNGEEVKDDGVAVFSIKPL